MRTPALTHTVVLGPVTVCTDFFKIEADVRDARDKVHDAFIGTIEHREQFRAWLLGHLDETETARCLSMFDDEGEPALAEQVAEAWWDIRARLARAKRTGQGLTLTDFEVYALHAFLDKYPTSARRLFDG